MAAILFGWIQIRAQQAAAENLDTEQTVRMTSLDPDPWDASAAMAILPELAAASSDIDWSKPLTAWSRETMAEFLLTALALPHVPAHREVLAMTSREQKIAYTLRMLNSDQDGDVLAAVHGLKRLLQALGTDLDGLARGFENILHGSGEAITQAEMQKAISDAYAAGVQDTENKFHGVNDFHSTDDNPPWKAIVLFLQRNKNRLDARHHEFVDDMASRTVFGREPTERQHKYLHSLFYKLGGKLT